MAWLRRIGLLGVFLFAGPTLVTTSGVVDPITVNVPTSNISLANPVKVGTAITFSVAASGGTGPLQYQYWIYNDADYWQVKQGYTTSNKFTFVTQKAGLHALYVHVRSAGSSAPGEAFPNEYVLFTVGTTTPLATVHIDSVGVSPSNVDTFPLNQAITFTVSGSGGNPVVMYEYYVKEGSTWVYYGGYTSGNVLQYTPAQPGLHVLKLSARQYGSSGSAEDVTYLPFTVGSWPTTPPLSHYVDTGTKLDSRKTCSPDFLPRFTGAGLQGEVSKRDIDRTTEWFEYNWNWATNTLETEAQKLGYAPGYNPGRVSFATNGRPLIRAHDAGTLVENDLKLGVLGDDGTWSSVSFFGAARDSLAQQGVTWQLDGDGRYYIGDFFGGESRVVYDKRCNAYAVIDSARASMVGQAVEGGPHHPILMHSPDGGRHWKAYLIPNPEIIDVTDYVVNMEVPTTDHVLDGPPALLLHPRWYNDINRNEEPQGTEGQRHVLKLVTITLPENGTLTLSAPKLISDNSISEIAVSGAENYAVSVGNLIHIVYPGATLTWPPTGPYTSLPPPHPGTPAFAVTYDRISDTTTAPVLLGVGVNGVPPYVLDDHNQPVIARDRQGFLHVMIASHNGMLYYRKSSSANSVSAWGAIEGLGATPSAAKYSYPSLIIDRSDKPFVVAREVIDTGYYPVAMRRGTTTWEPEKILVHPALGGYVNYFNKLSLDPSGRPFLSYGYIVANPALLHADEAAMLQHTFGWQMHKDNPACVANNHDEPPAQGCDYSGATTIANLTVLTADLDLDWANVRFEPATSGTFVGIGPRVWLDTANVNTPSHSVVVSWSGVALPSSTDWIGIFPLGAADTASVASCAPGCASTSAGHVTLPVPQAGTYEVRLFQNSQSIAASAQFIAQ